ncbi:hypothetical protein GEMRC1_012835 [Eukaryota sp. GEM-RC1]
MIVIATASYFLSANVLSSASHRIDQLYELTHVHSVSELLGLTAGRVFINLNEHNTHNFANILMKESEHLAFHLRRLTLLDPFDDDYTELPCPRSNGRSLEPPSRGFRTEMRSLRFPLIFVYNFIPSVEEARVLSAWTIGLAQALDSSSAGKVLASGNNLNFQNLAGIRGSLNGFSSAITYIYDWLVSGSDEFFKLSFFVQILMNVLIFIVTLTIGYILFARSFAKIIDERTAILNLFLYIPQKEIQNLLHDTKFDYMRKTKKNNSKSTLYMTTNSDTDSDTEMISKPDSFELKNDVLFDLQESTPSEIKTETHAPLPIFINILVISLTIFGLMIGGVSLFYLYGVIAANMEVNSHFHLALDARNTAADVSLLDRDTYAAIQFFTAFGDDQFLLNYFDLIYSGSRQRALADLLSLDLTEDQLLAISQVGTYANLFRRLEFISGTLICSIFEVDDSLCSRFNDFTYNSQLETNYFRDKLAYDDVVWYSTLEQDLEKSVNHRLNIARNSLYNSRWTNNAVYLMETLEGTTTTIVSSLMDLISDMFTEVSSHFNVIWITTLATSVTIFILCTISFLNRKSLRFSRFMLYIYVSLFAIIIFSVLYFSISAQSVFTDDISPLVFESRRLFGRVVDIEWHFNSIRRRTELLVFSGKFEHFSMGERLYNNLIGLIASFSSGELTSHPALNEVVDSISLHLDLIDDKLKDYIWRILVASKLATYQLPQYQSSNLVNITWDIDQLPLSERYTWKLPHGYSLSTSETDLVKGDEYLKNASRAILTSNYFNSLTRDLVESFADIRRTTTSTLKDTVDEFNNQYSFELELSAYLLIALLISVVIFCCLVVLYGLKKTKKAAHVEQKVSFPAMVVYTKQYIVTLSVLFILLSMFYIGSLIGFTQLRPLPRLIQDYGQRSALITRTTNDIVSAFVEPEQQVYYLNNAQISYTNLLQLHHSLVVNHVDGDSEQTNLLFNSKLDDNSRSFNNLEDNHGLHNLLITFVNSAELFSIQDISLNYSISSPDLASLLVDYDTLSEMSLESIDNLHSYSISRVSFFSTYVLIIFIAFIVVISISYIFVFRKMLKDLQEEELMTLEFLDMIPEDALSKVEVIRHFFATKI